MTRAWMAGSLTFTAVLLILPFGTKAGTTSTADNISSSVSYTVQGVMDGCGVSGSPPYPDPVKQCLASQCQNYALAFHEQCVQDADLVNALTLSDGTTSYWSLPGMPSDIDGRCNYLASGDQCSLLNKLNNSELAISCQVQSDICGLPGLQ